MKRPSILFLILLICLTCQARPLRPTDTTPFIGFNFWPAAILASTGQGGDRARLAMELDTLHALGVTNLRVLVGADGPNGVPSRVEPTLQTEPGVYNDTLLDGLDYLLYELEKRNMQAVLYLHNAWEWSGGYEQYYSWATGEEPIIPILDGWPKYMSNASRFLSNDVAKAMYDDHIRFILTRTNRYTGRAYRDEPSIYAWEIANEPRAFDEAHKKVFVQWIDHAVRIIKNLDPNHLLTTGSEGVWGCEMDSDLCQAIHALPDIDYMTCHIWPYNWNWYQQDWRTLVEDYIALHERIASRIDKPFVIEEFGFPRDPLVKGTASDLSDPSESSTPSPLSSTTSARDSFYAFVFDHLTLPHLIGVNIWAWGGYAQPKHETWQRGDDYTGDPAQEPQGLNSVFVSDTTTLHYIQKYQQNAK